MDTTEPFVRTDTDVLVVTIATAADGTALAGDALVPAATAVRELDPGIGAILLRGTGANFCAGGNVRDFAAAADRSGYLDDLAGRLHRLVLALRAAPVPVVAGVQGWAAGAGMSLVCGADIAIGGPSTRLRPAYPGIGLTPDGGMSWLLPRIVGASRARNILLTDATIPATDAVRLGLLSRLVDDTEIAGTAAELAHTLAAGPRAAMAAIRTLLDRSATNSLAEQLDLERESIAAAAAGPTGREGVDAFVAKRRPQWPR
ncbi:enoyl-CoA hydratase-related protein [Skermania piniformis]|nr:enoyl-CoA hydratase-related protein [Skermania piniformis]